MSNNPFAGVVWRDARQLTLEGRGWAADEFAGPYDRLPARARKKVRPDVWQRAGSTAGVSIRFQTDATDIFVRWRLGGEFAGTTPGPDMTLRNAGLDCYGRASNGKWYWAGHAMPWKVPEPDGALNKGPLDGALREYRVYLPLGRSVKRLLIGVKKGVHFRAGRPDSRCPVVVHSTSIGQGAGVSRPGMAYPSILQRRLDYPLVNLGFSSNGRMEPEVAEFIAEIRAAVFVIDCLPNVNAEEVAERMPKLVAILRARHPRTPVLFVGDRLFADAAFIPRRWKDQARKSKVQKRVFQRLARSDKNLFLLDAANFWGNDFEGSTDSVHPNDIGALRMAETIAPVTRRLLRKYGHL